MSSREKSPVGARPRPACRTLTHVSRARACAHAAGECFDFCFMCAWCVFACVCVCVCVCVRARARDCAHRVKRLGPGRNPSPRCRPKTSSGDSYLCSLMQLIPARTSEAKYIKLLGDDCCGTCCSECVHLGAAAFSTCSSPPTHQGYSGCCCNTRTHPGAASFSTKQHTSNTQILQSAFACAVKVELKVFALRVPERDADRPSTSKARRDCERVQACAAQTSHSAARKQFVGKVGSRYGGL